ncbi:hypothetical protein PF002_g27812 [Phytophthora fragariae]|uniref:Uncharacterized protein n=1 Tax=Phytophthora fragariae TaxID=53985 RepID=A0A6A3W906_9STRA|nr:hypothetical protein PF002_g27812 [Phytophthora fragariae]
MKASPTASPREEWLTTIAALYAISHRLVSIDKELVPTGKQRYPKLKGDEKALFLEQTVGQRWDIGRLMAYLQRHLVVDFELEDLDECTPDSRTSTVWKLTMKSAECPEYLRALAMSSVW